MRDRHYSTILLIPLEKLIASSGKFYHDVSLLLLLLLLQNLYSAQIQASSSQRRWTRKSALNCESHPYAGSRQDSAWLHVYTPSDNTAEEWKDKEGE